MTIYQWVLAAIVTVALSVGTATLAAFAFVWSLVMKAAQLFLDGLDYLLPDFGISDNAFARMGVFAVLGSLVSGVLLLLLVVISGHWIVIVVLIILVVVFAVIGLLADPDTDWSVKLDKLTDGKIDMPHFPFNP